MPPPSVSIATICLGFKNALAEGIKYGRFNCRYNEVMLICLSIPMKIYGFLISMGDLIVGITKSC